MVDRFQMPPRDNPYKNTGQANKSLKQYKARVENPWPGCHAMELWLEGNSILEVGNELVRALGSLGVEQSQVSRLIETEGKLWYGIP